MIFITGDTHIPIDISKLNTTNFKEQKTLTKRDYVIICGDFGGVWNNGPTDKHWQKWLKERNFTTLFIDGNHENFDLLNQYPVQEWNGGKVHFINDSVIHLMRGQVFTIDGLKFFTMGGATSVDKLNRIEGLSWWKEELPSNTEVDEALDNLAKHNYQVDYVLTHTTSEQNMRRLGYMKENNVLTSLFGMLENDMTYKHWYFGHFHLDRTLTNKHTVVYQRVIRL